MARYKHYDYAQMKMLPISFDRQILPGTFEHTLNYLIDEKIDLSVFEARYRNDDGGAPAYDPAILLKIILFAYSKGIIYSRRIEQLCRENVVCMALSADTVPHFTTIAAFVSSLSAEITTIFRNVLLVCDEAGLIGKEMFAIDGVKLPSNASKRGTLAACEKSLARLRTDRLDCYLLHWRGEFPLEETIAAFDTLVRDGKILSWGVSNFDVADLDEVAAIAGAGHPACNQVLYHLQERAIEHAVLPWCQKQGTALVAYTPFGQSKTAFDARTAQGTVLAEIAEAHQATPRQVALRFLLRHPEVFVIPKASRLAHVAENAAAGTLELSAAELARIDAAFPRGRPRRGLPTL